MKPYTLGIYEKAMPQEWDWPEKMARARAAGFDYIEMSVDETPARQARLLWTPEERRAFCRHTIDGLPVSSICLSAHRGAPIGSHHADIRERGMEIMRTSIELAYDLRISYIQLAGYDVYYNETSDAESKKYFTENLAKAAYMAAPYGIMLGMETMENDFMNTVAKGMEYVKLVNSPYLGMYPDVGNITNAGVDVLEDLLSGWGHTYSAHLKETVEGVFRDMEFGTGRVDFQGAVRTLNRMGVTRWTAECWYKPHMDPVKLLESTYTYLTGQIREVLTGEGE